MSNTIDMDLIKATFKEEVRELLEQFEESLIALEKDPSDQEKINAAFRSIHTIKGSSGLFDFQELKRLTHTFENLLDALRNNDLKFSHELNQLLLDAHDQINQLAAFYLGSAASPELLNKLIQIDDQLIKKADSYLSTQGKPEKKAQGDIEISETSKSEQENGEHRYQVTLKCSPEIIKNGFDISSSILFLKKIGVIENLVIRRDKIPSLADYQFDTCFLEMDIEFLTAVNPEQISEAFEFVLDDIELTIKNLSKEEHVTSKTQGDDLKLAAEKMEAEDKDLAIRGADATVTQSASIRVDASKLDLLVNLIGEMVMQNANLMQFAGDKQYSGIAEPLSALARTIEDVRDLTMTLRMVAMSGTFRKMERIVYDAAHALQKKVRLSISGAETELDKTIVEKIGDPLMHIIRNAVDHGIDAPETRIAKGRSETGLISLNAYHDMGAVVIEISDDGDGLNYPKILELAIKKNLADPNRSYTDAEIAEFIFLPGFSTADKITEISGRGVGMDVVRRNIDALRGTVKVESQRGQGSRFILTLPLTLAIIDGFLVKVKNQKFVLPLDFVYECIDLTSDVIQTERDSHFYNLRGSVLPYISLKEYFSLQKLEYHGSARSGTGGASEQAAGIVRESLIVVTYQGQKAGIVVDVPMGEYQTVIKPLGKIFENIPGISGATILASGEIALIIDVPSLMRYVQSRDDKKRRSYSNK